MIFNTLLQKMFIFLVFSFNPIFSAAEQIFIEREHLDSKDEPTLKDVSEEWKKEVSKRFDEDVSKIRQIITDGERNKEDLQDFLGRFEEQQQWIDNTISATKTFFDPAYNAVMQKKLSFKRLIKAQEKADEILKELVDEEKLSTTLKKQIRLTILYNLNSLILKEVEKGHADVGISDVEIRKVVTKVFNEIEKKRAEEHEIERVVKKDIEDLEKQIETLKKDLYKQKKGKEQLEASVKNLEIELEQTKKINLNLESLLKKIESDKEMLKDEITRRANFLARKELKPSIEKKNRENLDLQLQLKKLEQELRSLKEDLTPTPRKAAISTQTNLQKELAPEEKNEQKELRVKNPGRKYSNRK